ncbi:signal transduction histidine kinase [Pontibacter aydingkolensis]|uniref:histidine kinase n=1 Tax=Pontibacter aydingkolensis TaxID=1911536 RepID=A0ABS7CVX7_9BACT|nr:HAMP domain-containing sensor histidine kinase [Pontibacter aydingkolensis]MBW7467851.1 HAMP domain-containing histidine kinase [Pontibacter aydingkolensis]
MTFRTRLTITFTTLVAAIIVVISLFIYFFSERYTRNEFMTRLCERAFIAAQVYLEEDELSRRSFEKVRNQFLEKLPEEVVYIYSKDREPAFMLDTVALNTTDSIFDYIDENQSIEFKMNGRQWIGLSYSDNQGEFYILISAVDRYGQSKLLNLQRVLIICFLCSIFSVYVVGRFLSRQVLRPIAAIVQQVNKIRASNLHLRLQQPGDKDEVSELSRTFNQMLDRLEVSFEMQKNFISNASHELRNPLTAISGEIEVALLRQRSPEEYIASLEILHKETNRLEKLTSDLLNLAQTGFDEAEVRQEEIRLDELAMDCAAEFRQYNLRFLMEQMPDSPQSLTIRGNYSLLRIAVLNVLENAFKFSDNQEVLFELKAREKKVILNVHDKGIGIPADDLPHIFQPFYRGSNARGRKGTGIGLSLTEKIVKLHSGFVTVTSDEEKGTCLSIVFKV